MYWHSGRIQSGVSLLELLIWLAIVSVLLMVAIPTYGDMVIVNRLNSVTSELHGALLYTRSEAIKLGGNVVICRSATTLMLTKAKICGVIRRVVTSYLNHCTLGENHDLFLYA